jgi:hypothetical protein
MLFMFSSSNQCEFFKIAIFSKKCLCDVILHVGEKLFTDLLPLHFFDL